MVHLLYTFELGYTLLWHMPSLLLALLEEPKNMKRIDVTIILNTERIGSFRTRGS